jgi:glycosyltransferase involved in cell wall biosynthesis
LKNRLAILTTHPIQYQASWFRALGSHPELDLEVLFCHQATPQEQAAAGFGVEFDWDISLLDGYAHRFLKNVARQPRVADFAGLDTPELADLIADKRYDALIVNGWHYKSAWQAMRACWRTNTPVMVRSDSHLHTQRAAVKRVAKWPFYRWFISKLNACLPVGHWSRDYFLHYGAQPERIFIVPHVVDTDYFSRESERLLPQRSELRSRWGLDDHAAVFLFAGKFIDKKRPMDFVRAIGKASKIAPVAGLMVGDGQLRGECEAVARANNLPVKFAGFLNQSEVAKAYVAADALVLPSNDETWGLVVNEAMACGRPCFVSDRVGCGPDLIVSGETGGVFSLGDMDQLAGLMADYGIEPFSLPGMGRKAQEKSKSYSAVVAAKSMVRAVSEVNSKNN